LAFSPSVSARATERGMTELLGGQNQTRLLAYFPKGEISPLGKSATADWL
jgi:hypothetical protein